MDFRSQNKAKKAGYNQKPTNFDRRELEVQKCQLISGF